MYANYEWITTDATTLTIKGNPISTNQVHLLPSGTCNSSQSSSGSVVLSGCHSLQEGLLFAAINRESGSSDFSIVYRIRKGM